MKKKVSQPDLQNFIRCEIFFSYISKVLDIKVICQKFILKYLERVSKLLVLLNCNYLLVKCTKIIQRYRTSFGKK